uniref:low-temperature-induced 65 kDa protein-like n=1 Tax=Erigeron canadensis TaxID=72917 RepID=UPI001CB9A5AE|nr:low-temperature-induced 65 kDa protein-like [Erigeron canadensis]
MESQLQHTHGRHYDEQELPTGQHTGHDEDEQHHHGEKKSVIKKVKEKAKKLKNTITKHGHGHHHRDDDDDVEETVEDPEVHGAPMYDSARIGLGGPDAILAHPRGNLERPSVMAEDRYTKPVASHDVPPTVSTTAAFRTNLSQQSGLGGHQHQVYGQQDINPEKWTSKIGQPTAGMEEEVPFAPNPTRVPTPITEHTYGTKHAFDPFENCGQDATHGGLKSSIGNSTGMMKDPHAPSGLGSGSDPANYETKVTNPTHTGGKEAGLSQMQHSFDKMGIHDSGSEPKRFDPDHPENLPRDTLTGNQSSTQSSSYTEKMSSTASAIAEKAAVAKDAIASKLGYSGEHPTTTESHENVKNSGTTATDYAHKITDKVTETLAPVYEKVVDAGSSVMSKVQGTVSGTGQQQMHGTETSKGTDKGVSVKEYLVETLRPGDEDKALSDAITHAFNKGNQEESEKKSVEDRPMGRVTESVEVRTRLGTDHPKGQQSGNVTANKNVTERLSDAMGSWFGGKGNAPQGTLGTSYVTDQGLSNNPTGLEDKGRGRGQ